MSTAITIWTHSYGAATVGPGSWKWVRADGVQAHGKVEAANIRRMDLYVVIEALRDAAVLNLAARCGLRGCELSRANVGDLQQRGDVHVLLVQGKGKLEKDNYVVVGPDCLAHLQRYLSARPSAKASDPLFAATSDNCRGARLGTTTLRKIAKRYLRKIGINTPRITAHSLRHTAVSLALEGGATLLECKEMARHEVITTTMVYAHGKHRLQTAAELKLENLLRSEHEAPREQSTTSK